jgi:hypothetical protein
LLDDHTAEDEDGKILDEKRLAAARSAATTARLLRSMRGRRAEGHIKRRMHGSLRPLLPWTWSEDPNPFIQRVKN